MSIHQFNLSDFNPDTMSRDEIAQWLQFIGQGVRPQVARQWFPGQEGQYRHVRNMRNYLWNKLTAMSLRLDGHVDSAQRYEAICDRIYKQLPEQARW